MAHGSQRAPTQLSMRSSIQSVLSRTAPPKPPVDESMDRTAMSDFLQSIYQTEGVVRRIEQSIRSSMRHSKLRQTRRRDLPAEAELDTTRWMSFFPDASPIQLVVPGVHAAGSIKLGEDLEPERHCPLWPFKPWVRDQRVSQDKMPSVLLAAGCRYFELRVCIGRKGDARGKERYWLCNVFLGVSLTEWLQDARTFLDAHTSEVMIINVTKVFSFHPVLFSDHEELVHHIVEQLGGEDRFIPGCDVHMELCDLWTLHRQVMLIYSPAEALWEEIAQVVISTSVHCPGRASSRDAACCVDWAYSALKDRRVLDDRRFFVLPVYVRPPISWFELSCGLCCQDDHRDVSARIAHALQAGLQTWPHQFLRDGAVFALDFADASPELLRLLIQRNWLLFSDIATE